MTLWKISNKQTALIDSLVPIVIDRLNEMGFAVGQVIQCLRRSLLKGP